jgi:hypothetical protein
MYAQIRPVGGLETGLRMKIGDRIDYDNSRPAKMQSIEPFVDWNISRHLSLRLRTDFFQLETKEGNAIIDADVYDLRLTWQFSRRSYLRFTTQRFDIARNQDEYIDDVDARARDVGRQLLYSYKINPQTVFFLGYSDNLTDDDTLSGPEETERTAFMKIGYAFTP